MRLNNKGQSALLGAFLLFLVLIIISSGIYIQCMKLMHAQELNTLGIDRKYTEQLTSTLLACTIPEISYKDSAENNITLENKTVLYLILFDLWCRHNETANITSVERCLEKGILDAADALISSGYRYALISSYADTYIVISNPVSDPKNLPAEHTTCIINTPMLNMPGNVCVSLSVWRE